MSKGLRPGSRLEDIRQYASIHRSVRKKELEDTLGFTKDQVSSAIKNLCVQGYLKRVGHGAYEFQEVEAKSYEVEEKIWRAMKINVTFTCSEIARHADTSIEYVYKLFRPLREDNYIRQWGRKRMLGGGGFEKVWRLTGKGKERAERPENVFRPDPLISETVALNKLICSGLAKRDEGSRVKAIELCRSIEQQLSEDMEA